MKASTLWIAVFVLVILGCGPASFAEEQQKGDVIAGIVGNEFEVGGYVGLATGAHTILALDGRWLDDYEDAEAGASVCALVMWNAVPKVSIPVNGLLPQIAIPGLPESIDVSLDLGGRIGVVHRDEVDPEIGALVQLRLNPDSATGLAIRYERKFDEDLWSNLGDPANEHQVFLVLHHRFE